VLTVVPFEGAATVLSAETVCADGFVWRLVRVTVANHVYDGWMAEGGRSVNIRAQPLMDSTVLVIAEIDDV